jgi:hypothetical protein
MLQLFARFFVEKPPTVATRILCTSLLSKQNNAELDAKDDATHSSASAPHGEARADANMDACWRGRVPRRSAMAGGSPVQGRRDSQLGGHLTALGVGVRVLRVK